MHMAWKTIEMSGLDTKPDLLVCGQADVVLETVLSNTSYYNGFFHFKILHHFTAAHTITIFDHVLISTSDIGSVNQAICLQKCHFKLHL